MNRRKILGCPADEAAIAIGVAAGAVGAVLLTRWLMRKWAPERPRHDPEGVRYDDPVDDAIDDSFPASDPPSYMASTYPGNPNGR